MPAVIFPGSNTSLTATVTNPVAQQLADTTGQNIALGRQGDLRVSSVHSQWYSGSARGNTFSANANDATGRTILAPAGTTSGFMFYNPAGSGVNMEILEILTLPLTATDVVGVLGLEFGAPPTTVGNAATVRSNLINGPNSTALCKASYGSTIVAMTFLKWLPTFIQTTAGVEQASNGLYLPNGSLIIAPGGAVNIVSSTTQTANLFAQSVTWAEWLV